jgi:hypothetical protein
LTSFNESLGTPEGEPWLNMVILSLQTIHVYPTQWISSEMLGAFHQWYKDDLGKKDDLDDFER